MSATCFPIKRKAECELLLDVQISEAKQKSEKKVKEIEAQKDKSLLCYGIGAIGVFLGVSCGSLSLIVILGVIGCFIGKIIDNGKHDKINKQAETEKERLEQEILQICIKNQKEYDEYEREFEAAVQARSIEYTGSELAQNVISWMTEGFCNDIKSFARDAHIEKIEVIFCFRVFADKILCNLGEYDFIIHRCSNLKDDLSIAALARAIATALQVNVSVEYPQDISETPVSVDYTVQYSDDNAAVRMVYSAINGFYRPVEQW